MWTNASIAFSTSDKLKSTKEEVSFIIGQIIVNSKCNKINCYRIISADLELPWQSIVDLKVGSRHLDYMEAAHTSQTSHNPSWHLLLEDEVGNSCGTRKNAQICVSWQHVSTSSTHYWWLEVFYMNLCKYRYDVTIISKFLLKQLKTITLCLDDQVLRLWGVKKGNKQRKITCLIKKLGHC